MEFKMGLILVFTQSMMIVQLYSFITFERGEVRCSAKMTGVKGGRSISMYGKSTDNFQKGMRCPGESEVSTVSYGGKNPRKKSLPGHLVK